jgi:hypothetical protein
MQEPMKKKKSCLIKSKTKVVKHTIRSIVQHMQDIKRTLAMDVQKEEDDKKMEAKKETEDPNSTKKMKFQT